MVYVFFEGRTIGGSIEKWKYIQMYPKQIHKSHTPTPTHTIGTRTIVQMMLGYHCKMRECYTHTHPQTHKQTNKKCSHKYKHAYCRIISTDCMKSKHQTKFMQTHWSKNRPKNGTNHSKNFEIWRVRRKKSSNIQCVSLMCVL